MDTTVEYLPERPDELTADWLSRILDTPVSQVRREVLGDGVGFMGDVLRLHLEGADTLPDSIVVKLPKVENRVMGEMLGVYEREIMFFREFGHRVPLRIPRLLYSEFDRDRGSENQTEILRRIDKLPLFFSNAISFLGNKIAAAKKRRYLLIIEFLQDMQPGDQLAGLDIDGCKQVLGEVAALHSAYWNNRAVDNHFWLLDLDIDARLRHGMFCRHVDSFLQTAPGGMADKLNWLKPRGERLTRQFVACAPKTLLHCDLRLDNVVFDGSQCAFIDWQLVRAGPAAFDVAYFLTSALDESVSTPQVKDILNTYYDVLSAADNVRGYTFDALWLDYQRGLLLVASNLSSVEQVELGDGRGQAMMDAWIRRLAARLNDVNLQQLEETL